MEVQRNTHTIDVLNILPSGSRRSRKQTTLYRPGLYVEVLDDDDSESDYDSDSGIHSEIEDESNGDESEGSLAEFIVGEDEAEEIQECTESDTDDDIQLCGQCSG